MTLNVSLAWGAILEWVREQNRLISEGAPRAERGADSFAAFENGARHFWATATVSDAEAPEAVRVLADARQAARKARDFRQADALRDQLKALGWVVEDTREGSQAQTRLTDSPVAPSPRMQAGIDWALCGGGGVDSLKGHVAGVFDRIPGCGSDGHRFGVGLREERDSCGRTNSWRVTWRRQPETPLPRRRVVWRSAQRTGSWLRHRPCSDCREAPPSGRGSSRASVRFSPLNHLVISIAAGVTLAQLQAPLAEGTRVVRVMPNTPAMVGASATAYALGSGCQPADGPWVNRLFSAVGVAVSSAGSAFGRGHGTEWERAGLRVPDD
jgi:hypothetical protein